MQCDYCGNSVVHSVKSNTVSSCTPEREDGTRGDTNFCNEKCYDIFHEENYVKVSYNNAVGNISWYWDFKKKTIHLGNFDVH